MPRWPPRWAWSAHEPGTTPMTPRSTRWSASCATRRSTATSRAAASSSWRRGRRTWKRCRAVPSGWWRDGVDTDVQILRRGARAAPRWRATASSAACSTSAAARCTWAASRTAWRRRPSARGAQIHTGTCVQRLERLGGPARARRTACTPAAARAAQQVLLANGAARHGGYGSFGWLRRRIVPIGSFIVVTEPLGAERAAALLRERRTYVTVANIHHYFRLTPDHRLVFGGRARFAVSSPTSDAKSGEILRAGMVETFPSLSDVAHRLLLGRPGRRDAGPPAARRRARRPVLFHRLQRPRHADVGADGRAHGRGDGRRCIRQPVARP